MIAAAPKDAELQFALAKFYEDDRQADKAEAVYREVIDKEKLGPAGLVARNRLAVLRFQNNDVPGAQALTQQVLAQSPRDDEALLLRGNIALPNRMPAQRSRTCARCCGTTQCRRSTAYARTSASREWRARGGGGNTASRGRCQSQDPVLRLDFARLLAELGKADQAKPIVQDLVKEKPDFVDALDTEFKISASTKDLTTARSAAGSYHQPAAEILSRLFLSRHGSRVRSSSR